MSAPLRLTAEQLRDLAAALSAYSRIRKEYGVAVCTYDPSVTVEAADVTLRLGWDDANDAYYIDDRSGS